MSVTSMTADSSGQSNNFTASAVSTYDIMQDSPTNNFCTLNSLDKGTYVTLSEGNLKNVNVGYSVVEQRRVVGTIGYHTSDTQGYYWECHYVSNPREDLQTIGVQKAGTYSGQGSTSTNAVGSNDGQYGLQWSAAEAAYIYYPWDPDGDPAGATTGGGTDNSGVIVGIAVKGSKIWLRINGSWRGDGNPAGDSNPFYTIPTAQAGWYLPFGGPMQGHSQVPSTAVDWRWNFGQDSTFRAAKTAQGNKDANGYGDFYYSVPTGFLALCSKNLPTPTIIKPKEHFNTVIWTGADTSAAKSVTGVGFQPDYVWSTSRSDAFHWNNFDAVRGANKRLNSNTDAAEAEDHAYGYLSAFDSDGFTTAAGSTNNENWNKTSSNYVAYCWKAAGSTSNNTAGNDASVVSANADAGFNIVTYTDGGSGTRSVGHGLGKKPAIVLQKGRNSNPWYTYTDLYDGTIDAVNMDTALAKYDWTNGTLPTSTLFYQNYNGSENVVAYCWAPIESFSALGVYHGNGQTDNAFIYTGFTPALIMIKSSLADNWLIFDNKRHPFNKGSTPRLYPDATDAEGTSTSIILDFVSNGFKFWANDGSVSADDEKYMYLAVAEKPFKYANAR